MIHASTRLTHVDPQAEQAALAVALAAQIAAAGKPTCAFIPELRELLNGEAPALLFLLEKAEQSAREGQTTTEFAVSLGCKKTLCNGFC
jgi:ADP-ribosyl-[dinitrogen reductase] hydrolase